MEVDNFDTVIGSNFMRSYKVKDKSEKEYQALPSDIQSLISGVSDKLMIEDKEGAK